ncbi:MAG: glutathione S-transferase [Gammaproteobacteria bacterium]|nr:glutathione S-transferase [Gammaproteobacteria bacterium]
MSKIKLSYFDMDGGRGETTRIALSMAGLDWQDDRIAFADFAGMRAATPLNAVPVLQINGGVYTQSNAMNRYFGKQAGLYPDDPWQAFLCDEVLEAMEDVAHYTVRTFGLEGDALKAARKKLVDETFTRYLKFLDRRLADAGGDYFAGGRLSVADLRVFMWLRSLRSGILDHVPADLADKLAPKLVDHMQRIAAEPSVVKYYASRQTRTA